MVGLRGRFHKGCKLGTETCECLDMSGVLECSVLTVVLLLCATQAAGFSSFLEMCMAFCQSLFPASSRQLTMRF